MADFTPCDCGRTGPGGEPLSYEHCCKPWLEGRTRFWAPDAETLMRSRYTAYVREDAEYLRATWHAGTRPSKIRFETSDKWLGLQVRDHQRVDDTHAEVEFVARRRGADGRAQRMHERSRFVREEGRWYYVDGDWK